MGSLQDQNKPLRRFCSSCGKVQDVVLLDYVQSYDGREIWSAMCVMGHSFSPTMFGRNIVML